MPVHVAILGWLLIDIVWCKYILYFPLSLSPQQHVIDKQYPPHLCIVCMLLYVVHHTFMCTCTFHVIRAVVHVQVLCTLCNLKWGLYCMCIYSKMFGYL